MTAPLAALAVLIVGYVLGRYRPVRRAVDWANWQAYGRRPAGARLWAVWVLLSAENIGWLITHPVQGARAWKHRHDPPPSRSPAVTFRRTTPTP